jgi:hypothetical protein
MLLVCGLCYLFNDVLSSSDIVVLSDKMIE